jgi:hypothetical protein
MDKNETLNIQLKFFLDTNKKKKIPVSNLETTFGKN